MKDFIGEDFLLRNETAKRLYFEGLKDVPVFDYHCHLSAKEIYENKAFSDIGQLWLETDHYKWRVMRACGIEEKYITGADASYEEKFKAWAGALPQAVGNAVHTWAHMELKNAFGIHEELNEKTADRIWALTKGKMLSGEFTPQNMLRKANVKVLNTTDDPLDTLDYHAKLQNDPAVGIVIRPTWRPDGVLDIEKESFGKYVESLGEAAGIRINSFKDLQKTLVVRLDYFKSNGCISTDHSLAYIPFNPVSESEAEAIFSRKMSGAQITPAEEDAYKTVMLLFLAREYNRRGWVMELHIGAMRNNNRRMFEKFGPNSGHDSMDDYRLAKSLSRFLDQLDYTGELPKMVLFVMNPKDYYVIGTITGNHLNEHIQGKMQFGTAWWFNDNIDGIREHIKILANLSAIGTFIGMLTDSRSYLSYYSRHELFRRILCNIVGEWVEEGLYPNDMERLFTLVRNISFFNAREYFGV